MAETLYEALHEVALRRPDHPAYVIADREFDEGLTFAELDAQVCSVASALHARGLRAGDRIAIWLPNLPEWIVLHVAAARLGVTVLSINTRYRVEELSHLLALGKPRCIAYAPGFLDIDFEGMLERTLAEIEDPTLEMAITVRGGSDRAVTAASVTFEELVATSPDLGDCEHPGGDALVVLFPTSGTTSLPKLAAHDQAALIRHSANAAAQLEIDGDSVLLCPLPLCGAFGYNSTFAALLSGATCLSQSSFSGPESAQLGQRAGATHVICTDPMLDALIAARAPQTLRRGIVSITGDHPQHMIEVAEEALGVRLTDVYGSSECFALLAFWPTSASSELRAIKGGAMVSGVEVRVVDVESRADLAPGERGEILFRGYNVLRCYLDNEIATKKAIEPDGWYRTGDLGYLDGEGRLVFLSRLDDSLRLRGFLVNPGEVERLLERHPAVCAAQVVGVKSQSGNDLPVAFVIAREQEPISAQELQRFCRERAASYKVPEHIWFVEDFPRTLATNGAKVQRNVLRAQARALLSTAKSA